MRFFHGLNRVTKKSMLETRALNMIVANNFPKPMCEFRFCTTRRWRFDMAYPSLSVAIELEGGVYSGGRHTRGSGFIKDCEKYNHAALTGWTVLRYTSNTLEQMIVDLSIVFKQKEASR